MVEVAFIIKIVFCTCSITLKKIYSQDIVLFNEINFSSQILVGCVPA